MKTLFHCVAKTLLPGLLLTSCSTPYAVKDLAQETRFAMNHMADVHQQDLRTLAAYDRGRVAQFNHLLSEYLELRVQVVNALNQALDRAKQASLAELDHEFDRRAQQIITVQFWSGFRQGADRELNNFLLTATEKTFAKAAAATAYASDPEPRNQALLAARQRYLSAALAYETVEASFSELVGKIDQARADYHLANEKLFAEIKPLTLTELAPELKNFVLSNNSAEINQRVADLQDAYGTLDKAQSQLVQFLNENNPAGDFLVAVAGATVGVNNLAKTVEKNPLPASPAEANGNSQPSLAGLLTALDGKLTQVVNQKSAGANALEQAITTLISKNMPIVRVISNPAVTNPENLNQPLPAR
jgi:hypothetical protein